MNKFQEIDKRPINEVESDMVKYWKSINVLDQSIKKGKETFVFYDGPATANGFPGLHHMMAKFLKDTFCKYQTMKGKKVLRKIGWDTHGLPVELQVEKKLGFKNKQDIEKYGIAKFNEECKKTVFENEATFSDLTVKMGQFIDLDNAYITYKNEYIETEWWILKKYFDSGLFYEGHKILPYCSRCETGLASHEVAQGYKEVSVDTVTVLMKKKDEDVYFLVWTTTPWTLISNVALCVNPNEDYILIESDNNKFIIGKKLVSNYFDEYTILKEYKGKDLEYMEYEQLIPSLGVDKKAFYITSDNFVTMEDGTGIVHIAPAFGQDDYNVSLRYDLPVINPVNEQGKYSEGLWENMFVMDADLEIIKYLKTNQKLFKKVKIQHNYPHCWRCDTPLLYYSKPSYYLKVTAYKDKLIEENKKINWFPSYVGEKRFGNWLENLNDWAISRKRYWGTPLPLWVCTCSHQEMIGSIEELKEKSIEKLNNIDLHRPYVDNIYIKCKECGNKMSRVEDVIDVWFDSGSMPFAQYHYPFENKELFENQFPADFICEGIDQTRGWFYTLLVISTFVMGKSPYKNVLVNDLLLDKNGKKMSKSKGNIVNPFDLMEEYGADTIRWYLPYVSQVWTPIKFDVQGLKEVYSKFIGTLKNTYNFFAIYANTDVIDPSKIDLNYNQLEEIDKWILSKYNKLVFEVNKFYEEYDLTNVVRKITDFISEDLSNWYIRRNRRRFWSSNKDISKSAVYKTTYDVLVGVSKLIAPITPYISEELYRNLTNEESVHLAEFPIYDKKLINEEIEKRMDLIRELIRLGRNSREESKIKVRQPISEVLIDGSNELLINDLTPLINEELNVKKVTFIDDVNTYMNFNCLPNFKVTGKILGPKINLFKNVLQSLSIEQINKLRNNENIIIDLNGDFEVTAEMVEIRITPKEGFNVSMFNNNYIILNTTLTDELIKEGIAREIVSKVQNIRKEMDFNITDRIIIYYNANNIIEDAVDKFIDFIKDETLAINILTQNNIEEEYDINGHNMKIQIKKA